MRPADTTASAIPRHRGRKRVKEVLALGRGRRVADGATLLIYHRVGGATSDELDLSPEDFARQLRMLEHHDVVSLDDALDRLDRGNTTPSVVLTFDDGFEDVYENAWPLLRDRGLPFTVYLASAYMGAAMVWEGATAQGAPGRGMSWVQLGEMLDSGLCTVGNHTHLHVRPEDLSVGELDRCNDEVRQHLGVTPQHFTYPWGVPVPDLRPALRERFRSASTGHLGRNRPDTDRMELRRVPVRQSDPDRFFRAKVEGSLLPERVYSQFVRAGKAAGIRP
ncbi:polysaccharide deacetylase family protein [Intrasporangium sp. DVR]|uniref:polysaccharide deacetylase family protein n=1 Tax=Intrasporangium sp. DVR TaxID=3127867 RepID=UPI00313A7337